MMQQQNKLVGKQTMVVALPLKPPRCETTLEVERIPMVDFTTTQARVEGAAPSTNHEGARLGPL
jgi:hypothetical protein